MGYHPYTIYMIGWKFDYLESEDCKKIFKNIDWKLRPYSKPDEIIKLYDWIDGKIEEDEEKFSEYSISDLLRDDKSNFEADVSQYQHEAIFIGMKIKMSFETLDDWKKWVAEFEFVSEDLVVNLEYVKEKYGEPKIIHDNSMS